MFTSYRMSNGVLRLGLVIVFLWFGIDKFIHPMYWLNAWTPSWLGEGASWFKIESHQLIYFGGVFEVLVGLSLLVNFLSKFFSFLAIIFLIVIVTVWGVSEVTVRDFGLIGGLLAILFWPERRRVWR